MASSERIHDARHVGDTHLIDFGEPNLPRTTRRITTGSNYYGLVCRRMKDLNFAGRGFDLKACGLSWTLNEGSSALVFLHMMLDGFGIDIVGQELWVCDVEVVATKKALK